MIVAVIGGGNAAVQILENLHAVARKVHLIFTSEITADAAVMEQAACMTNLQTYIGYKVIQFIAGVALAGVPLRKSAVAATLDLPAKGVFGAVVARSQRHWRLFMMNQTGGSMTGMGGWAGGGMWLWTVVGILVVVLLVVVISKRSRK